MLRKTGTGKVAQQLKAFAVLFRDSGLVPSVHMVAYNHL